MAFNLEEQKKLANEDSKKFQDFLKQNNIIFEVDALKTPKQLHDGTGDIYKVLIKLPTNDNYYMCIAEPEFWSCDLEIVTEYYPTLNPKDFNKIKTTLDLVDCKVLTEEDRRLAQKTITQDFNNLCNAITNLSITFGKPLDLETAIIVGTLKNTINQQQSQSKKQKTNTKKYNTTKH